MVGGEGGPHARWGLVARAPGRPATRRLRAGVGHAAVGTPATRPAPSDAAAPTVQAEEQVQSRPAPCAQGEPEAPN